MQVYETFQNVPRPIFDCFDAYMLMPSTVLPKCPGCEYLCNNVDIIVLGINPRVVVLDNIFVLKSLQQIDLRI